MQPIARSDACIRACQLLLALALPLYALSTMQVDYTRMNFVRNIAPVVVAIESLVIAVCYIDGFRLVAAIKRVPLTARVPLALWLGLAWTAVAFAQFTILAIFHTAITTISAMTALALWDRLKESWAGQERKLISALAASLGIYAILAVLVALLVLRPDEGNFRNFGFAVSNVRQIGFFGVALVGIASAFVIERRTQLHSAVWFALLCAGWFLALWSGGRGAFLAAFVAVAAVMIFVRRPDRIRLAVFSLAAFFLAAPASHVLALSDLWGIGSIISVADYSSVRSASTGRFAMWEEAARLWLDRPWLGYAEGQFRFVSDFRNYNHPHNAIVQLLFQWGVLGTAALAWAAVPLMRRSWHAIGSGGVFVLAVGPVAGLLAHALVDGPLFYVYPKLLLAVGVAILCSAPAVHAAVPPVSRDR